MLSYSFKTTKIKRGTQNFSKREVKVRETSIVKVGDVLKLVHAHGNFVNLNYSNFSIEIIIPLYNSIVS